MSYTIKIIEDYYTKEKIDTTAALAGIAIVGAYSEQPSVVMSEVEGIKITKIDSPKIMSRKIRWPMHLDADFNFILTDRLLCNAHKEDDSQDRNAVARVMGEARVAIVNTNLPDVVVAQTVAHAMGHLLDVPTKQEARQSHCKDETCIMYANLNSYMTKVSDTSSLPKRILSSIGMPIKQEKREYVTHSRFCDTCADSIARNIGAISMSRTTKRRK